MLIIALIIGYVWESQWYGLIANTTKVSQCCMVVKDHSTVYCSFDELPRDNRGVGNEWRASG